MNLIGFVFIELERYFIVLSWIFSNGKHKKGQQKMKFTIDQTNTRFSSILIHIELYNPRKNIDLIQNNIVLNTWKHIFVWETFYYIKQNFYLLNVLRYPIIRKKYQKEIRLSGYYLQIQFFVVQGNVCSLYDDKRCNNRLSQN